MAQQADFLFTCKEDSYATLYEVPLRDSDDAVLANWCELVSTNRTFFEHLRALLQYLPFDDWDHLLRFMHHHLDPRAPDTS